MYYRCDAFIAEDRIDPTVFKRCDRRDQQYFDKLESFGWKVVHIDKNMAAKRKNSSLGIVVFAAIDDYPPYKRRVYKISAGRRKDAAECAAYHLMLSAGKDPYSSENETDFYSLIKDVYEITG